MKRLVNQNVSAVAVASYDVWHVLKPGWRHVVTARSREAAGTFIFYRFEMSGMKCGMWMFALESWLLLRRRTG